MSAPEPIRLRVAHAHHRLFRISGTPRRRLAPGVSAPLNLRLTNPHAFWLTVTRLRAVVKRIRAPRADTGHRCTKRDFAVARFSGRRFRLPAASRIRLSRLGFPRARWPRVRMINRAVNQDGCKGASLTLGYHGAGRR